MNNLCNINLNLVTSIFTFIRQESIKQNVPERPIPAEQWMTDGPWDGSRAPLRLTSLRNRKKGVGVLGTPKSGQSV